MTDLTHKVFDTSYMINSPFVLQSEKHFTLYYFGFLHPFLEDLDFLPITSINKLPEIPAIYFCISQFDFLYIGSTANLRSRWKQHHRLKDLLHFSDLNIYWMEATNIQDYPQVEKQLITHFNPFVNLFGNDGISHYSYHLMQNWFNLEKNDPVQLLSISKIKANALHEYKKR